MPRTARAVVGGLCYHVLNRGNRRDEVFHDAEDYGAFIDLLVGAQRRLPMRLLAFCLMPNHFHLCVWPFHDGDLSRWMHWLMTSHVVRHCRRYDYVGRIWQGRFKAFAIQEDRHLVTVLRYIERNPLRAGLVRRAEHWPWSSLDRSTSQRRQVVLHRGPLRRPDGWATLVNEAHTGAELEALRNSVKREAPFGARQWLTSTATRLGLESTLRPRGRPRRRPGFRSPARSPDPSAASGPGGTTPRPS